MRGGHVSSNGEVSRRVAPAAAPNVVQPRDGPYQGEVGQHRPSGLAVQQGQPVVNRPGVLHDHGQLTPFLRSSF